MPKANTIPQPPVTENKPPAATPAPTNSPDVQPAPTKSPEPGSTPAKAADISTRQRIVQVDQADVVKALGLPPDSVILHANYDWQSRSFYIKYASKENKDLPKLSVVPIERYQPPATSKQ